MKMHWNVLAGTLALAICAFSPSPAALHAQTSAKSPATSTALLNREQAAAILPPSVFYRGQSAPVQGRNSAGLKLAGDKLVLFTLVDTSGYSTAVQQTYQAYLLTEVPLALGDKKLQPGAYGFGFIAGDKLVVMDVGGNEIMRTSTIRDAELKRPNPLQLLRDAASGQYRLYLGRSYVVVSPAAK